MKIEATRNVMGMRASGVSRMLRSQKTSRHLAQLFSGALCALVLFSVLASSASAAVAIPAPDPPPIVSSTDSAGSDLITGSFSYSATEVTIGQSAMGGLVFTRSFLGAGWRDNYAGTINSSGSTYTVSIGMSSETFTLSSGTYSSDQQRGSTLTLASGIYTYTLSDGTVALFDTALANGGAVYNANIARVTTLTKPTGEQVVWHYKLVTVQSVAAMRLQSVTNNLGYEIHFDYSLNNPTLSSQLTSWKTLAKATGINTAVDYCDPTADTCSGFTVTWPSATYGTSGAYQTVTDTMGRVSQYSSSSDGLIAIRRPTSPSADNLDITYSSGKVSQITNGVGTWHYAYSDVSGQRTTTVTDPLSHTHVVVSDIAASEVLSDTDGLSNTTSYQYDAYKRVTRVTQPEGNYTSYTYDSRGNVTQTTVTAKSGSGLSDITTSTAYDSTCSNPVTCNHPNSITDARGFRTDFTYDSTYGVVLTVTRPAPSGSAPVGSGTQPQMRYSYSSLYAYYKNSGGSIVAAATPVYRLTGTSSCATSSWSVSACSAGNADETKSTIVYGSTGVANSLLPTSVSAAAGDGSLTATTATTYDSIGNVYTVDGPLSGSSDTTRYRFDGDRELVGVVGPDPDGGGTLKNRAIRTTYNDDGQVTSVEQGYVNSQSDADWSGFTALLQASTGYNALGQVTSKSLVGGGSTQNLTQYSYDNAGRLDCTAVRMNGSFATVCALGPQGSYGQDRVTRNTYDNADRLTKVTTGYGASNQLDAETLTYSNNGLVTTLADGVGNLTTYEYDGDDRRVKIRFPNTSGGGSSTTDYEQLTYDAAGNVTQDRRRDASTITNTIDNLNRITQTTPSANGSTISYTYDLFGRRLTAAISGGQTLTFAYDQLNRNTSQQSSVLGTVSYQYDLAGERTRITWPDTLYVQYDYDLGGDLTAIRENGASSGLGVLATYAYDNLGRESSLTRGNGTAETTGFDNASRLSSLAQDLSGSTYDQTLTLSYNPSNQLASRTASNTTYQWTPISPSTQSYTPNGLNQYSAVGGSSFTYDTRGNLTSDGSHAYTYDIDNHLLTGPGSAALSYDPAGRLYQTSASGVTTLRFLYDGASIIGEYDTSGTLQRRYVWGLSGPIVWYEGSGTTTRRWLIADEHDSIAAVTDDTGAVATIGGSAAVNTYDEYGQPGASNVGRFQYAGQPWIAEIGLYHLGARDYAPAIGRFLQTDPILIQGGINIYAYVGNDPTNAFDPSGLADKVDDKLHCDPDGYCPDGAWAGTTTITASDCSGWTGLCGYDASDFLRNLHEQPTPKAPSRPGIDVIKGPSPKWQPKQQTGDGGQSFCPPEKWVEQGARMVWTGTRLVTAGYTAVGGGALIIALGGGGANPGADAVGYGFVAAGLGTLSWGYNLQEAGMARLAAVGQTDFGYQLQSDAAASVFGLHANEYRVPDYSCPKP